jgi:uncharacterized protein YjbI with pentapeptide repeats
MTSTKFVVWGGLSSVLGGVLWIVMSLSRAPERLLESAGPSFIPLMLFLVGLAGLYAGWRGEVRLEVKAGFILTLPGFAIAIIANIIGLYLSDPEPPALAARIQLGGIAVLSIGMTLLGVAAIRAKALPRWSWTPLVAGLPGILIVPFTLLSSSALISTLAYVALALFGAGWIALGYTLWSAPFALVEKKMDQIATWLKDLAFFDVLETLGKLTVLIAAIFWLMQIDNREQQTYHEAWQVITSAKGQEGAGGRIEALQTLSRGGESLEGVEAENAVLSGVALEENTNLDSAKFGESDLSDAVLQRVSLRNADLEKANLAQAQLDGADLTNALLQETDLSSAELPEATLAGAHLQGAILQEANLQDAILKNADLNNANLSGARLAGANLRGAKLHNTSLYNADLSNADLTFAELENAALDGAVLDGAVLEGAMLNTDGLPGAKLHGADFKGAWLWDVDWSTDLRYKTDLRGVEHLTEEQIRYAKGDKTTLLPKGMKRPSHWNTVTNNLPDWGTLTAGEYVTEEFAPEFSFGPGEGWEVRYPEVRNAIGIENKEVGYIFFFNADEVHNPEKPYSEEVVEAPEDVEGMVKWFQDHPYLDTLEPAPVNIGGMPGMQLDVTASNVPEGYPVECKDPCLPLFSPADGGYYRIFEIPWEADGGVRIIVLDVGGEVVVLGISMIDAAAVRNVLEGIRWTGTATAILPGTYSSTFDPGFLYEVGEGWQVGYDMSNIFEISQGGDSWLGFYNVQDVYDPEKPETTAIVEAPRDVEGMVEWFQNHPYLEASEPEPIEVGGLTGEIFDVTVSSVPIDYQCETPCVGLFRDSEEQPYYLLADERSEVIVLEVEGKMVSIIIRSPEANFENFSAEAKDVLNSLEWIKPLKTLPPGYYTTNFFEPPASFELPGGWRGYYSQSDQYQVWKQNGLSYMYMYFYNAQEVYNPESLSLSDYALAPKDAERMVEWFQDHPYLEASEPEPMEIGGLTGRAFNVTIAPELPSYPQDQCNVPCVPLFRGSDERPYYLLDGDRHRAIVLDVKGEAVTVTIASGEDRFERFMAETQKVLDSVEWLQEYAPGERYSTEEFEPSFTFGVDEGWQEIQQIQDQFSILPEVDKEDFPSLNFVNVREVYDPMDPNFEKVSPAPEGVEGTVAWLQNHPHLNVSEPEPIEVGGAHGVRFDVSISSVPERYPPECGTACVPLFQTSDGDRFYVYTDFGAQFIVLDVGGETVLVTIESPEDVFDEFLPRSEVLLSTLKWGG